MTERSVVMEGSLDEFDLVSVVQTVSIGRQSTGIELRDDHGAVVGTLLLKAGQLVTANAEGTSGLEAVRRLLRTSRLRRFYVYRANTPELRERIGPVTQVLASLLTQPTPPQPEGPPMLMQGSLAQYDLRMVAEAVSLGRQPVGIEVFAPDGRRVGALYLKGGQILFAAWGRSAGETALSELFKPRKSGRFVVFRSPQTRIGEPIARLSDVLYPRPKPPSASTKTDSVVIDLEPPSGEVEADDTQITRVAPAPSEPASAPSRPSAPSLPPANATTSRPSRPTHGPASARPSVQPPPVPGKGVPSAKPPTASADPATVIPNSYPAIAASKQTTAVPPPPSAPPSSTPSVAAAKSPSTKPAAPSASSSPASAKVEPAPAAVATPSVASTTPASAPAQPPSVAVSIAPSAPVSAPSQAPVAPRFRRSEAPSPSSAPSLLDEPRIATPSAPPRTPILCITSAKGGSGRTTVTLNLAVTLARRGKRVVVVDADQNGLLIALNASNTQRAGAAEVLLDKTSLDEALITTRMAGLRLLPSGGLGSETYAHPGWHPLLNMLAAQADVVLVDCPAGLYGATPTLLAAATHRLMVIAAEPAALRVYNAHRLRLGQLAVVPPSLGIVLNMLDYQVPASVHALEELCASEYAREVLDVTIPRSPAFMEASARGLPIVHAEPSSSSAIGWLFETLASALRERIQVEAPKFAEPLLA